MKSFGVSFSLLALANGFVVPSVPAVQEALSKASLNHESLHSVPPPVSSSDSEASWWDRIPSKDSVSAALHESVDSLTSGFDHAVEKLHDIQTEIHDQLKQAVDESVDALGGGHHHHGDHDHPDLTIYQLINLSNYTKKFARAVDIFPDVVDLLNGTDANYTLFVPIDSAFDIPDDHEKPDKEAIKKALLYHVGLGKYPAKRILGTHTLPTALDEHYLGGEPQRLRPSVGLDGVKLNFYSKVVAVDIGAKNGVIHAVRNILAPPPMVGVELTLFPQYFSTLLLAFEKTDFVDFIHGQVMQGSTVFAPTNSAFEWLGPKANAFLFNTEEGRKHLRALLKYHIAPNATLYTDAFYDKTTTEGNGDEDDDASSLSREHFDLGTLLGDERVGVDIVQWGAFNTVRVNGFVRLSVRDAIAKNGVLQVVNRVLIPPRKHKDAEDDDAFLESGEMDVEDLKQRLADYVDDEEWTDEL